VLYVALTRPIHALHMIIAPSKENEKTIPATAAGILRAALADGARAEAEQVLYENGDPAWVDRLAPAAAQATEEPTPLVVRLAERDGAARRGLETQSPSQLEGGPRVDLADRLRLDRSAAMDWGTAVHACFEQITWLDGGLPDDDLLGRKLQALQLPQTDTAAVIARFRRALNNPEIQAVLRRSAYEAGANPQVWNERAFVVRREETILRGTIDRLVILFDGETLVGADIIDFKSDSLDPADPAAVEAKKTHYRPQLEAYRTAVAKLYGLPGDRITTRLVFVEPGTVIEV
jgi:ATP-dependent exoDNAse (exonuclease V) beta subunit